MLILTDEQPFHCHLCDYRCRLKGAGSIVKRLHLTAVADSPWNQFTSFYRAMHFSAKRGIAIACRLSVCLSVTLVNCDHIG